MRAAFQNIQTRPMINFFRTGSLVSILALLLFQTPVRAGDEDFEGKYESDTLEHVHCNGPPT